MAVREGKSGLRGISRRTRGREGIRRGKLGVLERVERGK